MTTRTKLLGLASVLPLTVALNLGLLRAGQQAAPGRPAKGPGDKAAIGVHATCDVPGTITIKLFGRSGDASARHDHAFWVMVHPARTPDGPPLYEHAWTEDHQRLKGWPGEPTSDIRQVAVGGLKPGTYLVRAGLADMNATMVRGKRPETTRDRVRVIRSMAVEVE